MKTQIAGLHSQSFWFSDLELDPRVCISSSQVLPMLQVWGQGWPELSAPVLKPSWVLKAADAIYALFLKAEYLFMA